MVPICGVCAANESKYKCPVCELRYCSIPCYKSHKTTHTAESVTEKPAKSVVQGPRLVDRPGTEQRVSKVDFTGFEEDQEFQRLLSRYPKLKYQLQLVYGLTLEPGPDEASSWSRRDWFPDSSEPTRSGTRDRGTGGRGRGRGRGRGGRFVPEIPFEHRPRGPWSQEKGDKQGGEIIHRMRDSRDTELADGMSEFVQLCSIKFAQPQ